MAARHLHPIPAAFGECAGDALPGKEAGTATGGLVGAKADQAQPDKLRSKEREGEDRDGGREGQGEGAVRGRRRRGVAGRRQGGPARLEGLPVAWPAGAAAVKVKWPALGGALAHMLMGRWARVVTTVEPVAGGGTVHWVFSSLIKHAVYALGATRKATV